uniref:Uncharacterized protein n=1 Tax=uncultured prokaryote TaxID=198431 RepID=A0A0H5QLJ4_9ZZZZ|nr:hypothetical protein [uncultured prokaryote]
MKDRKVLDIETQVWQEVAGFHVQRKTRYFEGTFGGGRIAYEVDRFGPLSADELKSLLEVLATTRLPGDQLHGEQLAMFPD